MFTRNRIIRFSAISLIALLALASIGYYIAVDRILPYSAIRPHRVTRNEITNLSPGGADPGAFGIKYALLNVTVEDSIVLKGWYLFSKKDSALGTIILLHGIGSCKEAMINFADTLTKDGYNCILYDSRAHGESGGMNCTFGYYERRDVSAFIDSALIRFRTAKP